jgi:hypothetical protein
MLVAVALTLIMMTTVVTVFGLVMDSISNSRATIEMTDRLRGARNRLQLDLAGATAATTPPLSPLDDQGYLEYIEGPNGALFTAAAYATETDQPAGGTTLGVDYSAGDSDDILMLTVRSPSSEPFTGRFTPWNYDPTNQQPPRAVGDPVIVQSRVAEVCWFVRGTTLYRRVLLILPGPVAVSAPGFTSPQPIPPRPLLETSGSNFRSYYATYDVSARQEDGPWGTQATAGPNTARLVANSLGDLTKRENRFGHQPYAWPYDARFWGVLRLPTLRECSSPLWPFPWNDYGGSLPASVGTVLPSPLDHLNRPLIVPNGAGSSPLVVGQIPASATSPPAPSAYPYTAQLTPDGSIPIPPASPAAISRAAYDAWHNPMPYAETQPLLGESRTGELVHYITPPSASSLGAGYDQRVSEDVILTNVLEFDIKIWDPGAPLVTITAPSGSPTIVVSPNENWEVGVANGVWSSINATLNAYKASSSQLATVSEGGIIAGFGAFVDLNYFCDNGISATGTVDMPAGAPYFPPSCVQGEPSVIPLSPPNGNLSPLAALGLKPRFHHAGDYRSLLRGTSAGPPAVDPPAANANVVCAWPSAVYDTWSTHYEQDGIFQRASWDGNAANWPNNAGPVIDAGMDGLDNDGINGVDDSAEQEAPPPYTAPLRAMQIKIRVFDPDSRQVRDVTLEHEFMPES